MSEMKFPYEDHLLKMQLGQEEVIIIKGRPYVVAPATKDDIERIKQQKFAQFDCF